ncbi:hypothetical protein SCNRRL3882_7315 [Streptomyces chartreusis NRRL 3882]|uniref:Uncharacterized protein n=1 Tax=Streptomyces chartreusis NRRL 3882 TaxID=1079985 RepID=A0A2N9BKI8_STRCX|nr:hypothetical protein SCNRRL3882_7315 [Streptomyces chartreusis NRRL 3882]
MLCPGPVCTEFVRSVGLESGHCPGSAECAAEQHPGHARAP